jgi:hypothetical protein
MFGGESNIITYGTDFKTNESLVVSSSDGGTHWNPLVRISNYAYYPVTMTPIDNDTIFMGFYNSNNTIGISTDKGITWKLDSIMLDTNYSIVTCTSLDRTQSGNPIGIFSNTIIFGLGPSIIAVGNRPKSRVDSYERIITGTTITPNPATNYITITSVDTQRPIHIIDILGREVIHSVIPEDGKLVLDISSLPHGVYYAQLDHYGKMLPIGKIAVTAH